MIPTRLQVGNAVRSLLGDTAVSGGGLYTQSFQIEPLNIAYQDLFTALQNANASRVQRYGFYLLPAYMSSLLPSVAGMSNFGVPIAVYERGTATAYAISAATVATPAAGYVRLTVAALASDIVTGKQAEIYGVVGISEDINDAWTLTVNSTTSVDLNGCGATGNWTSGGFLVYSSEEWSEPLQVWDDASLFATKVSASSLGSWAWMRNYLRFPICSNAREIRIHYELSSSLPTTSTSDNDSMGIDNSLNFLAQRTAQYCAGSKGNKSREIACAAASDRFLSEMLSSVADEGQVGEPIVPEPFRGRNTGPWVW